MMLVVTTPSSYEHELMAAGFTQEQGALWVDAASEIGICVSPVGLFVGWLDVSWEGPHTPRPALRAVTHVTHFRDSSDLRPAISKAKAGRRRAITTCSYCREALVPGHMHGDVCHSCAERHLGVVH